MCIILSAAILGPRAINVIWWLLASDRWSQAFNGGIILPILGILALPWTTLAFVLVSGPTGVTGWGIAVVVIGFFADLGTYGSSAYTNKDKLGYR
jgi:hypothetical protein